MTSLLWSPQSLRDLEAIRAYIAEDSPLYADLVVRRLVAAVERLSAFPESGRIVPERNTPEVRELIVRPPHCVPCPPRCGGNHHSFPSLASIPRPDVATAAQQAAAPDGRGGMKRKSLNVESCCPGPSVAVSS